MNSLSVLVLVGAEGKFGSGFFSNAELLSSILAFHFFVFLKLIYYFAQK